MKTKTLFFFLMLQATFLTAQEKSSFSLAEAIKFGLENKPEMKNARLEEEIALNQKREVTGIGLPQISASFDLKDFFEIPTSLVPGEFFGGPPGSFIPVKFGVRYNATAGVQVSQIIFSSDYVVALQASKEFLSLSAYMTERTRAETHAQIAKAYYMVLVNRERIKLMEANVKRLEKLQSDTRALYENGFVEKIDVDRIEVAYNNLVSETEKVKKLAGLSETLLKFQMGYDLSKPIELSDKLDINFSPVLESDGTGKSFQSRPEYKLLESQKKLNFLEQRRSKLSHLPSLVAYGSYSQQAQRNEFNIFNFSPENDWFPIGIIGATLTLPICSGGQKYFKLQQQKIRGEILKNQMSSLESALTLEIQSETIRYNNSVADYFIQKKNADLALGIYEITKKKYEQGVGSNLEVVMAQTDYRLAETNLFNALYELLIAKIDLEKSKGNLK